MKIMRIFATFIMVTLCFMFNVNTYAEYSDWTLLDMNTVKDNPNLVHCVWETPRPPYGVFDKIKLHRVVKKNRMFNNKSVIFMIPGTWNAAGWSEISDSNVNTMLYLAKNNYDVYTLDFRSNNIPDLDYDQYSELGIDISSTADWTYGAFREDIKDCVNFIKKTSSIKKLFMSGFSRGGYHMFFYARKYHDDLLGMVVFDVNIKDLPPDGTAMDEATYNQVINLFKAGMLVDPQTSEILPWLGGVFFLDNVNYYNWKLAGVLPYCLSMVGGALPTNFPVISDYVADNVYNLWNGFGLGEGALSNYYGGYIDRDIMVKSVNEFSRYYPNIQTLEDSQLDAYDDVPYLDYDDGEIYLPMVAFLSNYIGCPYDICLMDVLPNVTRSNDVTIHKLQGYGHMDILFGKNSLTDVKEPLLNWLNAHINNGNNRSYSQSSDNQLLQSFIESILKPQFQFNEN